jgi:GAF domain-containing protein
MAKSTKRAGKRALAAGRERPRAPKSGASKAPGFGSGKTKAAKSTPRKRKPSFASQIAHLKSRLKTARRQQQASAEVLRAVADAAGDAARPLQFIAETTARLFGAASVSIQLAEGSEFTQEYRVGAIAQRIGSAYPRSNIRVGGRNLPGTVVAETRQIHIPDLDRLDPSMSDFPGLPHARAGGARTVCGTPLRREGKAIGALIVFRDRLLPFTDDELDLAQSFADQAVIAIENARLFNETQEALEQQTATSEVLKIISRSAFDLQTVLDTLTESAARLCNADMAAITRSGPDGYYHATSYNFSVDWLKLSETLRLKPGKGSIVGRALLARKAVQIADVPADPDYAYPEVQKTAGFRTLLGVPLLRSGEPIGVLFLGRRTVSPFSDKQVELVSTFADQAVIAIENVRLFDEVQAKTRDLEESLQQQTATADVLKVISRSTFDLPAVLHALVETATRLCGADKGTITRQKEGTFYRAESYGFSAEFMNLVRDVPVGVDRRTATGRALLEGVVVHIPDVESDPDYSFRDGQRLGDFRSLLGVPMLREGSAVGVITLTRTEPSGFSGKQIELAVTFADQAAIAIENVRLFDELQTRTRELAKSLDDLRAAQDRLVQTEKLASLGQLTAGIAHEIKNPLNFVNNFSALSVELVDELNDVLRQAELAETIRKEVDELTAMLNDNLGRVVQHGKRADSIVKNMLLHSREGSGEHRPADVNALVEESLNLAYHGARAERPKFNVTLQRDFDPQAGIVEVFPQEITRVLLNLISNGFYAVTKRKADDKAADFEPLITATTRGRDDHVEISIRDNGVGIPPEVKEKMFNPFFTTKPAGEGTGLGLSMSHDIIVKQHGGIIDVLTEPGAFTEFIVTLQRKGLARKMPGETTRVRRNAAELGATACCSVPACPASKREKRRPGCARYNNRE